MTSASLADRVAVALDGSSRVGGGVRSIEVVWASDRWVSAICQVRARFDDGTSGLFWVKRHEHAAGEYRLLESLHARFEADPDLGAVRPVACLEDPPAVVTEDVPGELLSHRARKRRNRATGFLSRGDDVDEAFRLCGKWLAHVHEERHPEGLHVPAASVTEYASIRLKHAFDTGLLDREVARRIESALEAWEASIPEEHLPRVCTHGDFAPYNVLVPRSGKLIMVFDPDTGGYFGEHDNYCPPFDDLVRFHGFTTRMSEPFLSARVREALAARFLEGYNTQASLPVDPSTPSFRMFTLKYRLLSLFEGRASLSDRLRGKRARVRRFRRWLDAFLADGAQETRAGAYGRTPGGENGA